MDLHGPAPRHDDGATPAPDHLPSAPDHLPSNPDHLPSDDAATGEDAAAVPATAEEGVLTAAVLVSAAFRLRDERGLLAALRTLVGAVDRWEFRQGHGAA